MIRTAVALVMILALIFGVPMMKSYRSATKIEEPKNLIPLVEPPKLDQNWCYERGGTASFDAIGAYNGCLVGPPKKEIPKKPLNRKLQSSG